MKIIPRTIISLLLLCNCLLFPFFLGAQTTKISRFPYKNSGLTEKQAAAHLLSRFTYGAKPGQIDVIAKQGLENWFKQQLDARLPDDQLKKSLSKYDALSLTNAEIVITYPRTRIVQMAIKEGFLHKDSTNSNSKYYKESVKAYMDKHGLKLQKELTQQFISQKILRSAYSNNQLLEVMTSFWFNHFNVSMSKNQSSRFIPSYERDVIRPNALDRFNDLLLATAKSPAMLYYLDNASSVAENKKIASKGKTNEQTSLKAKKIKGLNENYAREVMELHTLGVDGGYTQQDVTEAARILTGWTVSLVEPSDKDKVIKPLNIEKNKKLGFIYDNDFLFNPNNHDKGEKTVMGKRFGPDGGYSEGLALLNMLAHHSSTAQFICRKLAVRFVSDNPPQTLIDKMAKTFREKDGQIKEILITMVTSPEFWDTAAIRQKTKSPFELTIGSIRNLNATIDQPYKLFQQITKMGEKIYYYQAPTGYPDKGQYWINTGSLLNRMNFGLALADGRIDGVSIDLPALNNNHEPESTQAALVTYSKLIMPERDLEQTIKRLTPMLNDPQLATKVNKKAVAKAPSNINTSKMEDEMEDETENPKKTQSDVKAINQKKQQSMMLKQVVGIIIGSPEYQRR